MGNFQLDPAGLGAYLRSEEMRAEMVRRMEKVKEVAEATAPFDPTSKDGTHFKESFRIESTTHGGIHGDRAEATLISDDPAGFQIEVGTGDTPDHHTMARALDAAGD